MEIIKILWAKLDGWKTYLGGIGFMLSGAGMLIADAVKIETGADAIAFISAIPAHPGTASFLAGFTAVGIGHKVEKAKAAAAAPAKKGKAKK